MPSLQFALSTIESASILTARPYADRIDLGPARALNRSSAHSAPPTRLDSRPQLVIQRLATLQRHFNVFGSDPADAFDSLRLSPNSFREFWSKLRDASNYGWLLCDNHPPATWFAGVCSAPLPGPPSTGYCPHDLYAQVGALVVTCPGCRATHNVLDRRDVLKSHIRREVVHARLAAAVLVPMVNADTNRPPIHLHQLVNKIYNWKQRRQLTPVGMDLTAKPPRPLYQLGDIMDCIWPPATP